MHIKVTYLKPTQYPNFASIPTWTLRASRHAPGLYASACVESSIVTLKNSMLGRKGRKKNPIPETSGKFSATKTFQCLLISDRWVTPSSNIFFTHSFTRLSTGLYKLANWKQKTYHKEPRLVLTFCFHVILIILQILVAVICIFPHLILPVLFVYCRVR